MGNQISRQAAIMDAESWVAVDEYEKNLQKKVIEWLKEFPPAQPEITRCKDCKHFDPIYTGGAGVCEHWHAKTENNVYCTYAERRTNG